MGEVHTGKVWFAGDLEMDRTREVNDAMPEARAYDRVIIDFSEVTSMASTIVSVLLRFRRSWIEAGKDPFDIVVLASPEARRILEISGLTKIFTVLSGAAMKGEVNTNAQEADGDSEPVLN